MCQERSMKEVNQSGRIARIVFTNRTNGYTVAHFVPDDSEEKLVVVGNMPAVIEGDLVAIKGQWVQDPRFGPQVKVEYVEPVLPTSVVGVERYLSSGIIHGVGKVTAQRLVAHFGEELLQVLEEHPERLQDVPGIGKKKAESIAENWQERVTSRRLLINLYGMGVGPSLACKLMGRYEHRAAQVVKENPFRLAREIRGVGFLTADRLAHTVGIAKDSPYRIEAGIEHFLDAQTSEGHCFYPKAALVTEVAGFLEVEINQVEPVLQHLLEMGLLREEARWGDCDDIYLPRMYNAESASARALASLSVWRHQYSKAQLQDALEAGVRTSSVELTMEQVEAIWHALSNHGVIVTGGPGTGKTTVIKAIINAFRYLHLEVALCAPTGRAAKRMTETTGVEAKTIHRLLEYTPATGFGRDRNHPLEATAVIVDEVSMIDIELMGQLLDALNTGTQLVLVGDKDQLESVGPGAVLRDCIASGFLPCVVLTQIHRQAEESLIVLNSHRILAGKSLLEKHPYQADSDFYFMEKSDPDQALETILEMVVRRIPGRFGFDPIKDVQVLSPMYRGAIGAENLNQSLQAALNPGGAEMVKGDRVFRQGDRVMQIRNNYDKEVFNGDVGFIARVEPDGLWVRMLDGRRVYYDESDLDELTLAYAVTIHKSQGSEYPVVVIALHTQHFVMLRRNLLYTAITRGKKLVLVVGSRRAVHIAVGNDSTKKRYTRLKDRIKRYAQQGFDG